MCGRFALTAPASAIDRFFRVVGTPTLVRRYNIAPTDPIVVVRGRDGERRVDLMRWGLLPSFARSPREGARFINARSETVFTTRAFAEAAHTRRCIVPADAFYEWESQDGAKLPVMFHRPDREPMALAGLWTRWRQGETELDTACVLTTAANALVASLHDRMPVVLADADTWDQWLDPEVTEADALAHLLGPVAADFLCATPVSTALNSVRNEGPEVQAPRGG